MTKKATFGVLHSIRSLDPAMGGPSRTVTRLCAELEGRGLRVALVAEPDGAAGAARTMPRGLRYASRGGPWGLRAFARALREEAEACDAAVVHDHGVWLLTNHASARLARRRGTPRVVSPRGMLDDWALAWHGTKKRVAWRLYQRRDLRCAALLHATSDQEAEGFRRAGFEQPVAVVPNGVDLPEESRKIRSDARVALFLSRIHPKKGLLDLVAAWAHVRPRGWELWIAGTDERNHVAEVKAAVDRRGLTDVVRFVGPLDGEDKRRALATAELFVLPTLSENFGMAVAEALAAGVPALTTTAAPWGLLPETRCGWWTATGPESVGRALAEACATSPEELTAMGRRGRALVAERFAWPAIAARMEAVYRWLAGGGPVPADVRLA